MANNNDGNNNDKPGASFIIIMQSICMFSPKSLQAIPHNEYLCISGVMELML